MSSIYDFDKILQRAEAKVKSATYPEEYKDLIFEFENTLFAEGIKPPRIIKYLSQLNILFSNYNLNPKATKRDMIRIVGEIEKHNYTAHTKHGYKITIKRFFRWLNGGSNPECTGWIKSNVAGSSKIPEELLTENEIKRMIQAAEHPRDRALIAILYDSGCRISEIGNLKIRDILFDDVGATLTVNGKTGMRRVRIIFSTAYITRWIELHPESNNPDSFLWINIGHVNHGQHMKYQTFTVTIKRIAKKAGIKKRVYNHLFRHSRSTELAQYLTQAQMESQLGWKHGSKMPATYIHLSGKQVDDAMLKMYGIKKKEDCIPELKPKVCPRCKYVNGATNDYCGQCGAALNIGVVLNNDERRKQIEDFVIGLIEKEPEVTRVLKDTS
jgi:integrase